MARARKKSERRVSQAYKVVPSDERRLWVMEVGDSRDLADRVHEQIILGGGYYAKKVDFEGTNIFGEDLDSENVDAFGDLNISRLKGRTAGREISMLEQSFAAPSSCQSKRNPIGYYPWGEDRKRAFIRRFMIGGQSPLIVIVRKTAN